MSFRGFKLIVAFAVLASLVATAFAGAEVFQHGKLRIAVTGGLSPKRLPRSGSAPIAVSVGGRITTTDKSPAPNLKTLKIEFNRAGVIDYTGLPLCPYDAIQPASSSRALSACRSALVGGGSFSAEIALPGQQPYPVTGQLLAFNGRSEGKPVLFAQIYAPHPFATSFVIVFAITKEAKGTFGTVLSAALPKTLGSWGKLTGIELRLSRDYAYRGKKHSYLSAGCPAPDGFPGALFPFARTTFGFEKGLTLTSILTRNCRVAG
ncbi:MAG TPA: hypothetical protein VHS74_09815 [Solirubrobacterales bacterium]|jgi:hypothetical protein|nr:hypothetical protein [Solirubrobacterales bacterium]